MHVHSLAWRTDLMIVSYDAVVLDHAGILASSWEKGSHGTSRSRRITPIVEEEYVARSWHEPPSRSRRVTQTSNASF